ncbi:MAG: DUF1292 domain-containing protein [Tenericutes bacterium]|nr:DUF1292 domain-containing protein [Mycoplasmatota bacterium]
MTDKLIIKNDEGLEIENDILFTFESSETNKVYVIYTNYEKDEENNIKVYSACYNINDENRTLEEVTTEKELNTINEILKNIQDEVINN